MRLWVVVGVGVVVMKTTSDFSLRRVSHQAGGRYAFFHVTPTPAYVAQITCAYPTLGKLQNFAVL